MKKTTFAIVALAFAIAIPALAQNTTTSPAGTQASPAIGQQPSQNGAQTAQSPDSAVNAGSMDSQTMAGTISADGKSFTSNGKTYTVSNPNSVKPYANQPVTVGYEMDTNNSIRITKLMMNKPQQQPQQ
jgi:uncharacterized membrane protein YfhO